MSETALRTVNALLLSERRSVIKKQQGYMKILVSDVNDENQECRGKEARLQQPVMANKPKVPCNAQTEAPAESPAQDIEYVLSEDLTAIDDANELFSTLLGRLDSKEWLTVLEALNDMRRLAVCQPDFMKHSLNKVVTLVIKAMKNPRSALCKTALMATTDLFETFKDDMLDFLDPLLLQLLLKATQDKRFVCEEAERALVGMTSWISPQPSLEKLRPYASHRNPRVRAKAATCVYRSVSRLGVDGINSYGLQSLVQIAAAQLNDQLPEAREAARKLVVDLHDAHKLCHAVSVSTDKMNVDSSEGDLWEQFCLMSLTPLTAQAVLRVTCVGNDVFP